MSELKDRVLATSIAAYEELESFGSDTVGYFYDNAKPSVRAWALATKALRDSLKTNATA